RTHSEPVADVDLLKRHLFVTSITPNAAGGFRSKVQKRADRAAGLFPRAQFENLPEQDEHGDDGSGLVIHGDDSVLSQGLWKETWCEGRSETVQIGGPHPER